MITLIYYQATLVTKALLHISQEYRRSPYIYFLMASKTNMSTENLFMHITLIFSDAISFQVLNAHVQSLF